ncbi:MAG: GTP-binding protein, partial [Planctomycetota bacterium]
TEIQGAGIERMGELTSGCVCCQINTAFAAAVGDIIETAKPDLIIIETTGLADPGNLAAEVTSVGLMLDAVITVVDAEVVETLLEETDVTGRQIRAADFLVLNKLDRVSEADRNRVEKCLRKLNGRAPILPSERGAIDGEVPFASSARTWRDRLEGAGKGHVEADGFGAFSWEGVLALDREKFERFLRRLPKAIFRAKGIVRFSNATWPSLFSFCTGRNEFRYLKLPAGEFTNRGVFIGRDLARQREKLLKSIARCEVRGFPAGRNLSSLGDRQGGGRS